MRKAGIQPMLTLHHFTNPAWLAERGGWLDPDVIMLFQRYVKKAVGELADLCSMWCTINEPTVYAAQSYFEGIFPPGKQDDVKSYFAVLFNMLQAHAAAYHTIHDLQPAAKVGLAHHMIAWYPRYPGNPLDRLATNLLDRFFNGPVLDTISSGLWKPLLGSTVEASRIKDTLDWFGVNYYHRYDVAFNLLAWKSLFLTYDARPGLPRGPKTWGELYPQGLFELITRLHKHFRKPLYITENGTPDENEMVRPGFILEHLREIWRAINFNIPVMGYYHWSLIDNFEWAEGYDPQFRFGLYAVDLKTQKRTLKTSGEMYKEICSTGTISSDLARRYAPKVMERLFPGERPPGQ
jgi:beta-glucosidase